VSASDIVSFSSGARCIEDEDVGQSKGEEEDEGQDVGEDVGEEGARAPLMAVRRRSMMKEMAGDLPEVPPCSRWPA
jgi:hypothetical protein